MLVAERLVLADADCMSWDQPSLIRTRQRHATKALWAAREMANARGLLAAVDPADAFEPHPFTSLHGLSNFD
jgi:hypothetical protein